MITTHIDFNSKEKKLCQSGDIRLSQTDHIPRTSLLATAYNWLQLKHGLTNPKNHSFNSSSPMVEWVSFLTNICIKSSHGVSIFSIKSPPIKFVEAWFVYEKLMVGALACSSWTKIIKLFLQMFQIKTMTQESSQNTMHLYHSLCMRVIE